MAREREKRPTLLLGPRLLELLEKFKVIELEDVTIEAETLELELPMGTQALPVTVRAPPPAPAEEEARPAVPARMLEAAFTPPVKAYPGRIAEVRLGATRGEGGTRSSSIVIGGERAMPFYYFEKPMPHKPVISFDAFDAPIPLPGPIKAHYREVLEDAAEWARLCVDKLGADVVTIHLVSTDPMIKDTSPREAARTVEEVLQAVKVPIIVGGSGAPEKDAEVLSKVAEMAQGERILLNSATLDNFKPIGEAAKKYGQAVIAWATLDMSMQRRLNAELLDIGLPKEQIVIDPTTAALGYGLEYSFSIMERVRLAGLKGDEALQMPLSSGTTNAWGAREAWLKDPELGPRELRGPLWEVVTGVTLLLAGCDLFMMMHPAAARTLKGVIDALAGPSRARPEEIADWIGIRT